jgi:hypothetical protein
MKKKMIYGIFALAVLGLLMISGCITPKPICTPNCACANNICIANSCSDGCGGNCEGKQACGDITEQQLCANNKGKWIDVSRISMNNIDVGIGTTLDCEGYGGFCTTEQQRPTDTTRIGMCSKTGICIYGHIFYEDTCLPRVK